MHACLSIGNYLLHTANQLINCNHTYIGAEYVVYVCAFGHGYKNQHQNQQNTHTCKYSYSTQYMYAIYALEYACAIQCTCRIDIIYIVYTPPSIFCYMDNDNEDQDHGPNTTSHTSSICNEANMHMVDLKYTGRILLSKMHAH